MSLGGYLRMLSNNTYKYLFILTIGCFFINIAIDGLWDGQLERVDTSMILLLVGLGFGLLWYKMIYSTYNYTR